MTLGEIIALRRLKTEEREGVTHFITGQHGARMHGGRHAQLSYADVLGHLVIMPCMLDERGAWFPMGYVIRCGQFNMDAHLLPDGFELSKLMLDALQKAAARKKP